MLRGGRCQDRTDVGFASDMKHFSKGLAIFGLANMLSSPRSSRRNAAVPNHSTDLVPQM